MFYYKIRNINHKQSSYPEGSNTDVFFIHLTAILFTLNYMDMETINQRFNKELQQQMEGSLPKDHTYQLGMPSEVLQSTKIPNLPIELRSSRLNDKSMQVNHPFDLHEIMNLPKAIHDPLAVFRSATHIGSYVIMTELEHSGKKYVVILETNKSFMHLEINSIRSIYPKNNGQIANWIEEGLMDYVDQKRTVEWLSKQRSNSADVRKLFNRATKIIQNFENAKL
jgi:hypothetical protein